MPSATEKSTATAARVEVYSQYRDMLIQYLFVSRARRYLRQIENLELMPDRVLRKQFEDRMQRLADRQAKLDAALASLMSNPLIDHRNTCGHSTRAGGYGAVGIWAATSCAVAGQSSANNGAAPLVADAVSAYGNPYGADGGNDFAAAADEEDWLNSSAPSTNINGLPMVGHVDIRGNPYGSTAFDRNYGF